MSPPLNLGPREQIGVGICLFGLALAFLVALRMKMI